MRGGRRVSAGLTVWMLALFLATAALVAHVPRAAADFPFTYLDGLDQAVTRHYGADDGAGRYVSIELFATMARFDSDANAEVAYDEVAWQYANGYASPDPTATPEASDVSGIGDAATAYTSITHEEILLEWYLETTVLVARDATDVAIVSATFQHEREPETRQTTELAKAMMASMLATEAGAGAGVEGPDGTFSGGLWETLPALDHEALEPYELAYSWDVQEFPEEQDADEATAETDDAAFDFGALDGVVRAVGREYSGDPGDALTPESQDAAIAYQLAAVAEFERDEQASAAMGTIHDAFVDALAEDDTIPLEAADAPDVGDQAMAQFGTVEEDGIRYEMALLVVQDGTYVYLVVAVGAGSGADAGAMDAVTAVAEAMVAADAGDGDGTFDSAGGSTGGVWDKLPAEGDQAIPGLSVTSDGVLFPAPPEDD